MRYDPACSFCRIIDSAAPAAKIYANQWSAAFLELRPQAPGHAVVMARPHFENLYQVDPVVFAETMETARRVAKAVRRTLSPEGVTLLHTTGSDALQPTRHFHLHVIPRRAGVPAIGAAPPEADPHALAELALRIAAAMRPSQAR